MSHPYEQAFQDFENLIFRWKAVYAWTIHSYVAVKCSNGPRLLFGRIFLEPNNDDIIRTPFKLETEHIIAGQFFNRIAPNTIGELLAKAKVGEIDSPEGVISLAGRDSASALSIYYSPIYHPLISDGPRLPSLLLHGMQKHDVLILAGDPTQLDWEMRAASIPFYSLDELLGHCGLPPLIQIGDSTTLEIVARSPATISSNSKITEGEAIIECRVEKELDLDRLRLGYRILHKDKRVERGSVSGDLIEWRQNNGIKLGSYRATVGEAPLLQALLSYDGESLHQWWATDPKKHLNPRHAIHQVFDQDLEVLRKFLFTPESDKPYVFESAISTLLTLLGFSTSNYGRIPKLQKGPDIIAITPSGHVGIIECTIGILSENDKLAKLVQRTKLIKEKLADAGYGHLQLLPAIVTPLSRDEVNADLANAGKHGIAVVCKENLEEALNLVSFQPNADRMFEDIKSLIPALGQQSLFNQ